MNAEKFLSQIFKVKQSIEAYQCVSESVLKESKDDCNSFTRIVVEIEITFSNLDSKKDGEADTVKKARNIYENMKNKDLLTIVKSIQTIDQVWDSWDNIKLTSVVKSDSWVNNCKKIFGFSSENASLDQNTFLGDLSTLMTKIGKIVTEKIEYVCMKLLSLNNQVESSFMSFLQFFTEAEILMFLEFMKLSKESLLRYLPIEKGSQSLFKKSKESLFKYFELHDQYFNKILRNYQIETLEKFLTSAQKGINVMKYIKDFASKFSIPLQVQEYILQSKDYKEMMKHVSQFVWKIEDSIYKTSFLLNNRCTNANREVLSKYYKTLKKEYTVISDARCLVNHLVPFGIVPSSILAKSLQHIKKETEELKKFSIDVMKSFPLVQENHTKIYTLYNNLIFIEKHFKDVAPSVANLASESRHDMEALCHSCLHDMLPQNNEIQSVSNLVEILILLKKSSMEILCYRNTINTFIDKILTENAKLSKDSGRFI
uniref:Uncharacterized protein n=1 Tax=Corethron hystrix TaxID=216773 RepID=A0A7S1FZZ4_9STRA